MMQSFGFQNMEKQMKHTGARENCAPLHLLARTNSHALAGSRGSLVCLAIPKKSKDHSINLNSVQFFIYTIYNIYTKFIFIKYPRRRKEMTFITKGNKLFYAVCNGINYPRWVTSGT